MIVGAVKRDWSLRCSPCRVERAPSARSPVPGTKFTSSLMRLVLEQHVVIARSPIAFHGAANDGRVHFLKKSSASVHVLTRTATQAKVVQAHSVLHKAFASQRRVAGFDADRGSSANAMEQIIAVEHRLHPNSAASLR